MKKIFLIIGILCLAFSAQAAEEQKPVSGQKLPVYMQPTQEQRKAFKQRNKQIHQLTKKYRKATTAEEKTKIKAQVTQIVSDATDANMAWALERVASEKENLTVWENKLKERQKNLEQIKARRVDEILSGEAEQRYKLAKKRWKKEMKEMKRNMK